MNFIFVRSLHILLLVVSITSTSTAQSEMIKNREITTLFESNKELWIKRYTGTFDHVHPIVMAIATDGKVWKGIYRFESSQTAFVIEAEENNDTLKFIESNDAHDITAHLILDRKKESLTGYWSSVDNKKVYPISLRMVQNNEVYTAIDTSYIEKYSKNVNGQWIELTYIVESSAPTLLELSINNKIISRTAACQNVDCTELIAQVGHTDSNYKSFQFKRREKAIFLSIEYRDTKNSETIPLDLDGRLDYESYTYIDYSEKRDLLYPRTNTKFDRYFDSLIEAYIKQEGESVKQHSSPERLSNELLAWIDIHYYDAKIISGLLFCKLDDKQEATIPFIYDLSKEKPLDVDQIFTGKDTAASISQAIIKTVKRDSERFDEPALKQWFSNQDFDLLTLNQEGLSYNTEYNTIAGTQSITIPYEKLEKYIHKEYKKKLLKK